MRELIKKGTDFELTVVNKENRSKTVKAFTKKELKDIYKEINTNVNNIETAYSKARNLVKQLDDIKTIELEEIKEFIDLAESVKKFNEALSAEKQIPELKNQLDELKIQKSEIEKVIPEVRRG